MPPGAGSVAPVVRTLRMLPRAAARVVGFAESHSSQPLRFAEKPRFKPPMSAFSPERVPPIPRPANRACF